MIQTQADNDKWRDFNQETRQGRYALLLVITDIGNIINNFVLTDCCILHSQNTVSQYGSHAQVSNWFSIQWNSLTRLITM